MTDEEIEKLKELKTLLLEFIAEEFMFNNLELFLSLKGYTFEELGIED